MLKYSQKAASLLTEVRGNNRHLLRVICSIHWGQSIDCTACYTACNSLRAPGIWSGVLMSMPLSSGKLNVSATSSSLAHELTVLLWWLSRPGAKSYPHTLSPPLVGIVDIDKERILSLQMSSHVVGELGSTFCHENFFKSPAIAGSGEVRAQSLSVTYCLGFCSISQQFQSYESAHQAPGPVTFKLGGVLFKRRRTQW